MEEIYVNVDYDKPIKDSRVAQNQSGTFMLTELSLNVITSVVPLIIFTAFFLVQV